MEKVQRNIPTQPVGTEGSSYFEPGTPYRTGYFRFLKRLAKERVKNVSVKKGQSGRDSRRSTIGQNRGRKGGRARLGQSLFV